MWIMNEEGAILLKNYGAEICCILTLVVIHLFNINYKALSCETYLSLPGV